MTNKTYTADVLQDPNDPEGCILQFPDEMVADLGWKDGDELNWEIQDDGSVIMSRIEPPVETEWVLVETISTFRERYMVEVPKGKKEYALDTVTMEEAKEFSQEHIGEQIISHRVVTEDEAIALCDEDNAYTKEWTTDSKKDSFFTTWKEQQKP